MHRFVGENGELGEVEIKYFWIGLSFLLVLLNSNEKIILHWKTNWWASYISYGMLKYRYFIGIFFLYTFRVNLYAVPKIYICTYWFILLGP